MSEITDHMTDRKRIFSIIAASSGNLVEWFDFYIYAFTAIYFAQTFFPLENPTTQLLSTAAIFAVGFFMRPLGGWLFGHIADRYGRKTSMLISILMMCGGSLLIAIMPTYAQIGLLAPMGLLFARLLQGLSVGGEYGTSATYMSEIAVPGRRGFFASFQYVTLIGGQLLAVLVLVILQQIFTVEALYAWAWRIPFMLGALSALIVLYLRRSLDETSTETSRKHQDAGSLSGLFKHKKTLLTVIGFTAGGSLAFYTYTTYMQKYLVNTAGMSVKTVSHVMTAALFVFMLMQPFFGWLSDKVGRRTSLACFGGGIALCTVPLLQTLGNVSNPYAAFGLLLIALAILSFYTSMTGLIKAEMFPTEIRALGVGLSYAIGNALFGGTAEYIALALKNRGSETTFYWYVTIMAAISFLVALSMREPSQEGYLKNTGK